MLPVCLPTAPISQVSKLTESDPGVEGQRFDEDVVREYCEKRHHYVNERHVEDDGRAGVLGSEIILKKKENGIVGGLTIGRTKGGRVCRIQYVDPVRRRRPQCQGRGCPRARQGAHLL